MEIRALARLARALAPPIKLVEMTGPNSTWPRSLTQALEAIDNLVARELNELFNSGHMAAMIAHDEIELAPIDRKTGIFYRHLLPLRKNLVTLLANSYRRCFKLALAHPHQSGGDPHQWAWGQLQPAVGAALEWIRDWYMLACDGENQYVRPVGTIEYAEGQTSSLSIPLTAPPFPPPKSWRAPAWLFQVSPTVGVGPLRTEHVPANDSEQKLGAAHTRLLLKGARRVFLWELAAAIERVRNEETAAAGAIPVETAGGGQTREPKKPKHWLKGIEGLTRKADFSQYKHGLTEKQELAFSLKYEYQVGPAEIASRMGLDRKTAYEHLKAADRRVNQTYSSERRKARRAKSTPE